MYFSLEFAVNLQLLKTKQNKTELNPSFPWTQALSYPKPMSLRQYIEKTSLCQSNIYLKTQCFSWNTIWGWINVFSWNFLFLSILFHGNDKGISILSMFENLGEDCDAVQVDSLPGVSCKVRSSLSGPLFIPGWRGSRVGKSTFFSSLEGGRLHILSFSEKFTMSVSRSG